jgi:D-alanyl-D-alanine carboxypeptidase
MCFAQSSASEPAGPGANRTGLAIFEYTTRCGVVYGHTGNTAGYAQFGWCVPRPRAAPEPETIKTCIGY